MDLLEPRPVDLDPGLDPHLGFDLGFGFALDPVGFDGIDGIDARVQSPASTAAVNDQARTQNRLSSFSAGGGLNSPQTETLPSQPRFVMGGIFEVMEGRG